MFHSFCSLHKHLCKCFLINVSSNITALGELADDNTGLKASANTAQSDEPHCQQQCTVVHQRKKNKIMH